MNIKTLLIILVMSIASANAEDIDIYTRGESQKPNINVLVILDNNSNWGAGTGWGNVANCSYSSGNKTDSKFCYIQKALSETVKNVAVDGMNIGLMMYTDKSSESTGYPRYALRSMGSSSNSSDLQRMIDALRKDQDGPNANSPLAMTLYESYLYFDGLNKFHADTTKTDDGTLKFSSGTPTTKSVGDTGAFASGSTYKKILTDRTGCNTGNYIIILMNDLPNDGSEAKTNLEQAGGNSAVIPLSSSTAQGSWADEWSRFLYTSHGIQTFTIDVGASSQAQGPNKAELLKSVALHGNGAYFSAASAAELSDSLKKAFDQIQVANSIFAPVALPSGGTSSGASINQVYVGMFRPDKNPRWAGNLKLYELGLNNNNPPSLILKDQAGKAVENTTLLNGKPIGGINSDVQSYWTHSAATTASNYWNYRCAGPAPNYSGLPNADPTVCGLPQSGSDAPDGAVVEKGGAAQRLRQDYTTGGTNSRREVYTDKGISSGTLLTFSALNTGLATNTVNWARGVDNATENPSDDTGSSSTTEYGPRPSIPGDILHSTPVVVNYNSSASGCTDTVNLNNDIVAFYGSNDGMLHAIRGGKIDKIGTEKAGSELWAFAPESLLTRLDRLRNNSPPITFPAPVPATLNTNKPYMIDGNLSVYAPDANFDCKPDKVWLFVTLRRGGDTIYALDVSTPANPRLLWKKSGNDLTKLGQTWSTLKPITLANGKPALIFGAGYDETKEDKIPSSTETRTKGNDVYVLTLNSSNGSIESAIGLGYNGTYSIPSDVATVADLSTGYIDLAYVGDTGGNIWKINFRDSNGTLSASSGNWSISKLASLGSNQKFLFSPAIVRIDGSYAVLIGSGDREKPFDTSVTNRFYMIKDSGSLVQLSDLTGGSNTPSEPKGWYFDLESGEKTVGSPTVIDNLVYFPTYVPPTGTTNTDQCSLRLGEGRLYSKNYLGGPSIYAPTYSVVPGRGFPAQPVSALVDISTTNASGQPEIKTYQTLISGTNVAVGKLVGTTRRFDYWYREGLD